MMTREENLPKLYCNKRLYINQEMEGRVCHIVPLPFTLKSIILRQKKNYTNSNISPCKKYNLQKKESF
jgi:hypothetical protein